MKITFCWNVFTEAEIPENEVAEIYDMDIENLNKGDKFAELARKYNAIPIEEGEITGVFQDWEEVAPSVYKFESDLFDEAIWEA